MYNMPKITPDHLVTPEILDHRQRNQRYYDRNHIEISKKSSAKANKKRLDEQISLAGYPPPKHCECCGGVKKLVWDHWHNSGKFRGWICIGCNVALGCIEDNPMIAIALARYLHHRAP